MKRTLATLAILFLPVSGLFAAGQGEGGKREAAPELIVQLMADSPADKDLVTDAINGSQPGVTVNLTATYGLPGSSKRNEPPCRPLTGVTVMPHVSIISALNLLSSGS